jgi:succinyl-CoA synthetase beta subunit
VVRLEGTEVEEARKLLADSKLNIIGAVGLTDAAKKVTASIKAA